MSLINISEIAKRYALALYQCAKDNKNIDDVEQDLNDLQSMIDSNDDMKILVSSPIIDGDTQSNAMRKITDKMACNALTVDFVNFIIKRDRLSYLPQMISIFRSFAQESRGEINAVLASAQPLTDKQKKDLTGYLETTLNKKISLEHHIDESLIGGFTVKVASQMIDASIANQLKNMRIAIQNT